MKKKRTSSEDAQTGPDTSVTHRYDKIWRENLRAALPGLIEKVLHIDVTSSEALTDKLHLTSQRETDGLWKVTDAGGHTFVLHIEVQVSGREPDMANRMANYRIMARQIHRLPVKQYVFYLGEGTPAMPTSISEPGFQFQYTLICFHQIPYRLFLSSEVPEEKILAILGDFGTEKPEIVLQTLLNHLRESSGSSLAENKYFQQLRVITKLRNLTLNFNKIMESVAKFFNEEEDFLFIRGIEKGRAEGEILGEKRSKTEVVKNLLRMDKFSIREIAGLSSVTEEFVRQILASSKSEH